MTVYPLAPFIRLHSQAFEHAVPHGVDGEAPVALDELDKRARDRDIDLVRTDFAGCVVGRFAGTTGSTAFLGCDHVRVK